METNCPKCGKTFITAPYHVFRDEKGFYCSWTCYNHRGDKIVKRKYKTVEQYSEDGGLIRVFTSATDAAEYTGFSTNCIRNACKNGNLYNGFRWKYK